MSDTEANEAEETSEVAESEFQDFQLDLEQLIHFFDETPKDSVKQATSMVAVFGEDLGLALLREYCEKKGYSFNLLEGICTMQKQGGSRLDAWIRVDTDPEKKIGPVYYFQTEIKNWSAHALDGEYIPLDIRKNGKRGQRPSYQLKKNKDGSYKKTKKEKEAEEQTWDEMRFSRFRKEFAFYYRKKGSNEDALPVKDKTKDEEGNWEKVARLDSNKNPKELKSGFDFFYKPKKVEKVLKKMVLDNDRIIAEDKERMEIHPLLCYWFASYPHHEAGQYKSPDNLFDTDEFFNLELSQVGKNFSKKHWDKKANKKDKRTNFDRLYVFSLSSFVRNILDRDSDIPESMKATFASSPKVETDGTKIKVKMKILGGRKRWIDRIFPPQ